MRCQLFGQTGLRVSELFLGAMTFGEQGGVGAPLEECRRMVDAYADAGGNVIDTASNYRGGLSETIVGELLEGRRDRFVLATKYTVSRDQSDPNGAGNHRKNLVLSLETSLRRLRTDYIDVYWVHIWDERTPVAETMRALDDAVRAGKVLYIGISDTPAWVVARANTVAEWRGWTCFAGLQVPYSLLKRDIERDLLPMAEAFGMTLAAWSPLAGGVLSGKFTRPGPVESGTRISPESIGEHDRAVAQAVQEVADDLGATPSQVAIAWTMAHSSAVHPILGARRLDQLLDNLGAADCKLPPDASPGSKRPPRSPSGSRQTSSPRSNHGRSAKRPQHAPIHREGPRDTAPLPRSAVARLADRHPQNAPGDWYGVRSRVQAVIVAYESGLVQPGDGRFSPRREGGW